MKKFFIIITFLFIIIFSTQVLANQKEITETIHFFEQRGCQDCARQKEFLDNYLKPKYPELKIISYSIMNPENQAKFHEMMAERGIKDYALVVPTTFIGNNYFQNFFEGDKELMEKAIFGEEVQTEIFLVRGEGKVKLPILGYVDINAWSLPVMAAILGSVDGLNVCSIGALILILTLVLTSFKSRKKIILFGGLFILTAVVVYGLLIFAWTALFHELAKYINSLNIIIGLVALGGGIFFFKNFIDFYRYGPACEYKSNKFLAKITNKLKKAFSENKRTSMLLIWVALFAFTVTLVELPCSISLPMIYAGMLATEGLSTAGYVGYVLLYLFFFMLIELIIFGVVVATKEMYFAESKWITWIYLLGSLVLLALSYNYLIGF